MADASRENLVESEEIDESEIVERIFEAVIEQRLPPGTKLSESALCEAFGVGRMRIRRSLLLLASQEVVILQANRGAFIASPTAEQAHEVFEARRMIEPGMARLAVEQAGPDQIALMTRHLEQEHAAHRRQDRREAIRLSGQFHSHLAAMAGNAVMQRMMKELISRTSLIISVFGSPGMSDCRDDEHGAILEALRNRDGDLAADIMLRHLQHIEAHLHLTRPKQAPLDVVAILKQKQL